MNNIKHDLINVAEVNTNIIIEIRYATKNNFTGEQVYTAPVCFLRKATVYKLNKVQQYLDLFHLRLKIWDAYRPASVQFALWDLVPDERYVANPYKGSRHSRGAAVDLTLVDTRGKELLMPTEFDDFTQRAHRDYQDLPQEAIRNRNLLEKVMTDNGFIGWHAEWWHFDDVDWQNYDLLDISFAELLKKG